MGGSADAASSPRQHEGVHPLDPSAAAFLAERAAAGVLPDHRLTVQQMRAAADVSTVHLDADLPVSTHDRDDVRGPGGTVPVRVATPRQAPLGVVVYAHGGGHVTGTLDSYDRLARRLAAAVPATVVLIGYRLAPEHRWPAAVHDVEASYHWASEHRVELAGEGAGVAIAGDSAGGHLAAVVCRRLRDSGAPRPVSQTLVYPTLDAVAYHRAALPSHRECATGCGLLYDDGLVYWDHYLGAHGDPSSPDASALRAIDLRDLPPAVVVTAEHDVLRDEGRAYAERLREAGVQVDHRQYDGQIHGFLGDPDRYPAADVALRHLADRLAQDLQAGRTLGRPD